MKRFFILPIAFLLALAFGAPSCAVDEVETGTDFYNRALEAWIRVNYGSVPAPDDSGVFYLERYIAPGATPSDSTYVGAHYVRRSLDGNIASTNREELCRQLGTWKATGYYGSDIWQLDNGHLPAAVERALKQMPAGSRVVMAVPQPQTILTTSAYSAFPSSESTNVIYEVEVDTLIHDVYAWQDELLREHADKYYNGIDTLSQGLYFYLKGEAASPDSISDGSDINVRYIARRLDGTVFDTNIRDSARFHRIYSASSSYGPLSITYYKEFSSMKSNNSYVDGFLAAINNMRYGDTCVTFFRSDLGYGATGSNPSVPEYSPMEFTIIVEPR